MTCECSCAGWCPVYGRTMTEKDFALCQRPDEKGEKFRTNCAREAGLLEPQTPQKPLKSVGKASKQKTIAERTEKPIEPVEAVPDGLIPILLDLRQCAGDCLVATAALESLAEQYPNKFWIGVDAHDNQAIFTHNPHIHRVPSARKIEWGYPLISFSNQRPIHFMEAYTASLEEILGVPLTLTVNRPYLYLSDAEKGWKNQVEELAGRPVKFWLINAGYKDDFTTKAWLPESWQEVVDQLRGVVQFVQIGRTCHHHPQLRGVIDLRDKTDIRQLIRLAYHAEGGVGPSTFLQHIMAAWQKPYVLVDSAREPESWWTYPNQISVVRRATLPCCSGKSCWATKTLGDCQQPWFGGSVPVPRCSAMIRPDDVVRAIRAFYEGGRLSF